MFKNVPKSGQTAEIFKQLKKKSNKKSFWSLYRSRPFQRAQICEYWSLGTGDMWRHRNDHKVKDIHID
jgi:hypothetical protein